MESKQHFKFRKRNEQQILLSVIAQVQQGVVIHFEKGLKSSRRGAEKKTTSFNAPSIILIATHVHLRKA